MSLTVNNCNIVYFETLLTDGGMIELGAKFEKGIFSTWIKPFDPPAVAHQLKDFGLDCQGSEMFYRNKKLATVPLKTALLMFHGFLKSSPKQVILVSHSSETFSVALLNAIKLTNMVDMFRGVIAGFSDSLLIFRPKFPWLRKLDQFGIENLFEELTGREYFESFANTVYYLDVLEELVSEHISLSEFIQNTQLYEEAVGSEDMDESLHFVDNEDRDEYLELVGL